MATFTVNSFDDVIAADTNLTLREAIIMANATAGADTIVLPTGTYTFAIPNMTVLENASMIGDLDITTEITIRGAGAESTRIDLARTFADYSLQETSGSLPNGVGIFFQSSRPDESIAIVQGVALSDFDLTSSAFNFV